MPDHLHFFCAPARPEFSLDRWVRFWKSLVSRRWIGPKAQPLWQQGFWDRQLRDGESYLQKWEYVVHNPVRAGLVKTPGEWPYAGEVHVLPW